jgi:hypothetical protein
MEDMKVIFLDFDGVLNSQGSFLFETRKRKGMRKKNKQEIGPVNETLDPVCCSNFQYVLDKLPDVKIVISSSWRTMFDLEWLKSKLASYGIDSSRVIDKTPEILFKDRGVEIEAWLNSHTELNITAFAIIDDNFIGGGYEYEVVLTSWNAGFTLEHARKTIQVLGCKVDPYDNALFR